MLTLLQQKKSQFLRHASSPVSHLLPLCEHLSGPHLNRQVQSLTQVAYNTLVLQQQGNSVE